MKQTVASLAQQYGIALVLRFDSESINPTDRGEVIKGVNRTVVYHHKLDLTNMVICASTPRRLMRDTNPTIANKPAVAGLMSGLYPRVG